MSSDTIQSNKLKLLGKFTAGLLHEIRNPLSAIKLNLDLVKYYENELPGEVNESINDCVKATERIEDLIENLLHYARRSNNELEWLRINDITQNAVDLLIIKASKRSIQLNKELADDLPLLFLNENKLLQVFLNLIANAIDACENKGKVIVKTYTSRDPQNFLVVWEVEDDGAGISEANQKKIFEDFFTSKPEGTGLGLTVCKSLLEEMDAELNFHSVEGKGTRFLITFKVKGR